VKEFAKKIQNINDGKHIEQVHPTSTEEGWELLKKGNQRFASGDLISFLTHIAEEVNVETRHELIGGQHPFAIIVTCSDSRVSPELIFDQGLGELFVIRTAGNVIDTVVAASIEYAMQHLGSFLLVLMGHQSCGAVTAAVDTVGQSAEGNIGKLVQIIHPAVKRADELLKQQSDTPDKNTRLSKAIEENVLQSRTDLLNCSPIVKEFVESKKARIVTCVYSLGSGQVVEIH